MSESNTSSAMIKRLEEEGEVGADYLEDLLDIVDLGGDIDIDIDHGRASIAIVAAEAGDERDLADLVGRDGEVLEAVQELTRLAVQARTGNRSRLMLDINGYRAARRAELAKVAQEAVRKVQLTGEPVSLASMNPFERKVCHDVVAAAGLVSESEGAEPHRHVVVMPAEDEVDDADEVEDADGPGSAGVDETAEVDDARTGDAEADETAEAEDADDAAGPGSAGAGAGGSESAERDGA
nr:R3H domain-containing nucleic acid-binding protein [Actinomyces sp. oral taxon 414]